MNLSYIELLALLCRFAIIGQLLLLLPFMLNQARPLQRALACALSLCFCGYLLLTLPLPKGYFGDLRGPLLLLTELLPYLAWAAAMLSLKDNFAPGRWPLAVKASLLLALAWFGYFFGMLQGRGAFHQLNHLLQILLLSHLLFEAIRGLSDDLVDARRRLRLLLAIYSGFYISLLILFELLDASFRGSALFSLVNGLLLLLAVEFFALFWLRQQLIPGKALDDRAPGSTSAAAPAEPRQEESRNLSPQLGDTTLVDSRFSDTLETLSRVMADGYFRQSELTVAQLAGHLGIREHQLRELINRCLGFRNFSAFLNSYRIPAACERFEHDRLCKTAILTVALELGYGSIGPFNRAFKDMMGMTPSEFRRQCQNRH